MKSWNPRGPAQAQQFVEDEAGLPSRILVPPGMGVGVLGAYPHPTRSERWTQGLRPCPLPAALGMARPKRPWEPLDPRPAGDPGISPLRMLCAASVLLGDWVLGLLPPVPLSPPGACAHALPKRPTFRLRPCGRVHCPRELLANRPRR